VKSAVLRLKQQGVGQLLLIPMFPHYAMSSFETAVVRVKEVKARFARRCKCRWWRRITTNRRILTRWWPAPSRTWPRNTITCSSAITDCPNVTCARPIPPAPTAHGGELLRMVSEAHRTCYRVQCFRTTEAFVRQAGVTRYSVAFQSRLGRESWLQPYTHQEIVRLARDGIKRLLVLCPAFVRIARNPRGDRPPRPRRLPERGGQAFTQIPCLNTHPRWIAAWNGWWPAPSAPQPQAKPVPAL